MTLLTWITAFKCFLVWPFRISWRALVPVRHCKTGLRFLKELSCSCNAFSHLLLNSFENASLSPNAPTVFKKTVGALGEGEASTCETIAWVQMIEWELNSFETNDSATGAENLALSLDNLPHRSIWERAVWTSPSPPAPKEKVYYTAFDTRFNLWGFLPRMCGFHWGISAPWSAEADPQCPNLKEMKFSLRISLSKISFLSDVFLI